MVQTKRDSVILISRVTFKYLPFFEQFGSVVQREISKPCSSNLRERTHVIPMPVLFRNEQYCQDVVFILEFYTNTVFDGYNKAGRQVTEETRIHIEGDQLKRERFSGAKAMRDHDNDPHDRLQCLRPISFEISHMQWQCPAGLTLTIAFVAFCD